MLSKEEITLTINNATQRSIETHLKPFFIEREQHYQDHQFVNDLREWLTSIRQTATKTMTRMAIIGIVAVIALGLAAWGRELLK